MSNFERYSWKESSPGTWKRLMDESEIHYSLITQRGKSINRQSLATTAIVKFDIFGCTDSEFETEAESLVTEAWKSLRWSCPAIASVVEGDHKVYRIVEDEEMLEKWVKSTLFVIKSEQEEVSAETVFTQLQAWLTQPTLYFLPKTKELVLRCTHDWVDAEGAIRLLNEITKRMSEQQKSIASWGHGNEAINLSTSIPFSAAAAAHLPSIDTNPKATTKATQALVSLITAVGTPGLPVEELSREPGDVYRVDARFTPEETRTIISKAKEQGLTVTHIMHAAMIVATAKLTPSGSSRTQGRSGQEKKSYVSNAVFGLRQYRDEASRSDIMSVNNISWPMVVASDPHNNLLNTAQVVKRYYKSIPGDPMFLESITPYLRLIRPAISSTAPMVASSSVPALSSVGRIDHLLAPTHPAPTTGGREVIVHDFWLSTTVLDAIPACHLWAWQGELRLNIAWNEAYHTRISMLAFGEMVKAVLLDACKMKSQC
ncbi:hypothetical protein F5884DRAFT_854426 [Xylogone sp. PMI_703]|nr:hypothetical protein F5884DRAFT_854426 [Xylogone sp. PMI_703]